jgi:hypothetical protein
MSGAALATQAAPGRRVAVMQPYLFPYLGTFQLARQVDRFVFYDDVAFIKQGYINRNTLLLEGRAQPFTAPVRKISSFRNIIDHDYVGDWQPLLALIRQAYARAPHFEPVFDMVQRVLLDPDENVARKNARSFAAVFDYLGLPFEHCFSSPLALPPGLRASARLRAVCRAERTTTYINAIGGRALYDPADFERDGMALRFCAMRSLRYGQGSDEFVPNLSILDALMHCPPAQVIGLLDACDLLA